MKCMGNRDELQSMTAKLNLTNRQQNKKPKPTPMVLVYV